MDKVIIKLDDDGHGNSTETFWVKPWFKENSYQIRNIPFFAKGISLDDVIEINEIEGVKYFNKILRKSGHSTYRIFLKDNISEDQFQEFWKPLDKIGCSYEKAYHRFYSLDIPPETDIYKAYALLASGEKNNIWDFEEADVGHVLK